MAEPHPHGGEAGGARRNTASTRQRGGAGGGTGGEQLLQRGRRTSLQEVLPTPLGAGIQKLGQLSHLFSNTLPRAWDGVYARTLGRLTTAPGSSSVVGAAAPAPRTKNHVGRTDAEVELGARRSSRGAIGNGRTKRKAKSVNVTAVADPEDGANVEGRRTAPGTGVLTKIVAPPAQEKSSRPARRSVVCDVDTRTSLLPGGVLYREDVNTYRHELWACGTSRGGGGHQNKYKTESKRSSLTLPLLWDFDRGDEEHEPAASRSRDVTTEGASSLSSSTVLHSSPRAPDHEEDYLHLRAAGGDEVGEDDATGGARRPTPHREDVMRAAGAPKNTKTRSASLSVSSGTTRQGGDFGVRRGARKRATKSPATAKSKKRRGGQEYQPPVPAITVPSSACGRRRGTFFDLFGSITGSKSPVSGRVAGNTKGRKRPASSLSPPVPSPKAARRRAEAQKQPLAHAPPSSLAAARAPERSSLPARAVSAAAARLQGQLHSSSLTVTAAASAALHVLGAISGKNFLGEGAAGAEKENSSSGSTATSDAKVSSHQHRKSQVQLEPPPLSSTRPRPQPRLVPRDDFDSSGSANIVRLNRPLYLLQSDAFHVLLGLNVTDLVTFFFSSYLLVWLFFGSWVYFFIPSEACNLDITCFQDAMYLSLETLTTIGYGVPDPYFNHCPHMIGVLAAQVLTNLFCMSAVIGTVLTKISKGQKRAATVMFSEEALVEEIDGYLYFAFQLGELRKTTLIKTTVRCFLCKHDDAVLEGTACGRAIERLLEKTVQKQRERLEELREECREELREKLGIDGLCNMVPEQGDVWEAEGEAEMRDAEDQGEEEEETGRAVLHSRGPACAAGVVDPLASDSDSCEYACSRRCGQVLRDNVNGPEHEQVQALEQILDAARVRSHGAEQEGEAEIKETPIQLALSSLTEKQLDECCAAGCCGARCPSSRWSMDNLEANLKQVLEARAARRKTSKFAGRGCSEVPPRAVVHQTQKTKNTDKQRLDSNSRSDSVARSDTRTVMSDENLLDDVAVLDVGDNVTTTNVVIAAEQHHLHQGSPELDHAAAVPGPVARGGSEEAADVKYRNQHEQRPSEVPAATNSISSLTEKNLLQLSGGKQHSRCPRATTANKEKEHKEVLLDEAQQIDTPLAPAEDDEQTATCAAGGLVDGAPPEDGQDRNEADCSPVHGREPPDLQDFSMAILECSSDHFVLQHWRDGLEGEPLRVRRSILHRVVDRFLNAPGAEGEAFHQASEQSESFSGETKLRSDVANAPEPVMENPTPFAGVDEVGEQNRVIDHRMNVEDEVDHEGKCGPPPTLLVLKEGASAVSLVPNKGDWDHGARTSDASPVFGLGDEEGEPQRTADEAGSESRPDHLLPQQAERQAQSVLPRPTAGDVHTSDFVQRKCGVTLPKPNLAASISHNFLATKALSVDGGNRYSPPCAQLLSYQPPRSPEFGRRVRTTSVDASPMSEVLKPTFIQDDEDLRAPPSTLEDFPESCSGVGDDGPMLRSIVEAEKTTFDENEKVAQERLADRAASWDEKAAEAEEQHAMEGDHDAVCSDLGSNEFGAGTRIDSDSESDPIRDRKISPRSARPSGRKNLQSRMLNATVDSRWNHKKYPKHLSTSTSRPPITAEYNPDHDLLCPPHLHFQQQNPRPRHLYYFQQHRMRLQNPSDREGGNIDLDLPQKVLHRIDQYSPVVPNAYRDALLSVEDAFFYSEPFCERNLFSAVALPCCVLYQDRLGPLQRDEEGPSNFYIEDHKNQEEQSASIFCSTSRTPGVRPRRLLTKTPLELSSCGDQLTAGLREADAEMGSRCAKVCNVCGENFLTDHELFLHCLHLSDEDERTEAKMRFVGRKPQFATHGGLLLLLQFRLRNDIWKADVLQPFLEEYLEQGVRGGGDDAEDATSSCSSSETETCSPSEDEASSLSEDGNNEKADIYFDDGESADESRSGYDDEQTQSHLLDCEKQDEGHAFIDLEAGGGTAPTSKITSASPTRTARCGPHQSQKTVTWSEKQHETWAYNETDQDHQNLRPSVERDDNLREGQRPSPNFFEFMVMVEGTEPITSHPIQARYSYIPTEIHFGRAFTSCVHPKKSNLVIDYSKFQAKNGR